MSHSMSILQERDSKIIQNSSQVKTINPKLQVYNQASMGYLDQIASLASGNEFYKSMDSDIGNYGRRPGSGSINLQPKGVFEPDDKLVKMAFDARGVREKFFNISFDILREICRRVAPIGAIQNVRAMQIKPFSTPSYNDDDVGFKIRLKNKKATPDREEIKVMEEIEEFIYHAGYTKFEGAEEREEGLTDVMDMVTRDVMTIDQVAFSLRRNRKGKLLDYWALDGATIKRIIKGKEEKFGDKRARFVQEVMGRIVEVFTNDDIIFTYSNRRSDIRARGYGYSYIEMCVDIITAWLFGMSYNKEVFNSSAQPKGIITFEGDKLDQADLEELQRQWISMFRGVKGMWRTPFLAHNARWIPMAPSNRDMEFNQYIQMLGSWICAIHGIDAMEMGIRLNQAQNVLNENQEAKIAYSKDRGLKDLLYFHSTWINKIIDKVPEWEEKYESEFTGLEAKNQLEQLEIDEKQVHNFYTVNEKRAEKDLKPIDGGDIILDPVYIQNLQNKQMAEQESGASGESEGDEEGLSEGKALWEITEDDLENESMTKAWGQKDISKLVKKEITNKLGHRQTVWVKPGEDPHKVAETQRQETGKENKEVALEKKADGFFYYRGVKLSKDQNKAKDFIEKKAKGTISPKEFPPEVGQIIRVKPYEAGRKTEVHKPRGIVATIQEIMDGAVKIADQAGKTWTIRTEALEFAKSMIEDISWNQSLKDEYIEIVI